MKRTFENVGKVTRAEARVNKQRKIDKNTIIFKIMHYEKCFLYLAYCKKYNKHSVGSCIEWKPRLRNYKSHIKNKIPTCRIVHHFIDECNDRHVPLKYLAFPIIMF